jgi:hypothetical protein
MFFWFHMLTLRRVSSSKVLPLGSDFPIEGINPLLGFYAAVSRLSIDGGSPHGAAGWYAKTRHQFNFLFNFGLAGIQNSA